MDRSVDQSSSTETSSTEPGASLDEADGPVATGTAHPVPSRAVDPVPPGTAESVPPDAIDSVPLGTAPEVLPALGTSETMKPVMGVHTPDVGEGGRDFDTAATPLPGRTDHGRT